MPRASLFPFVFLMCICVQGVHARTLLHQTLSGEAVVLRLQFAESRERPVFEAYQLYAPGSDTVFQRGFVNADGEVVFVPRQAGRWTLQLITEDGYGATVAVQVGNEGASAGGTSSDGFGHGRQLMLALGLLLGFFGMLALAWTRVLRRRRR